MDVMLTDLSMSEETVLVLPVLGVIAITVSMQI